MKINIIKTFVTSFLVTSMIVPVMAFAQVPAADGQNSGGSVIAAEGQNTGGATVASPIPTPTPTGAPQASGQNTGGATQGSGAPSAEGQNTGGAMQGGTTGVPAAEGQNTGGATAGTPSTDGNGNGGGTNGGSNGNGSGGTSNTGGSTSSSGSSGSSISSTGGRATTLILPPLVNIGQCNYLSSYLKMGKANPTDQVTRLQTFLKTNEGLNVDVTGFFDQKTFSAVEAFQAKYVNDVMLPWGVRTPTGQVYYTTRKKINELYCKKTFALTPAQIAEIEAYRTSRVNDVTPTTEDVGTNEGTDSGVTSSSTDLATDNDNGSEITPDTQTAAVGGISLARRLWNFIKFIFGR